MKKKPKSFGVQLWTCFTLFAAGILVLLWLLQTVFLQFFYDRMVMRNVQTAAEQIITNQSEPDFYETLDKLAYENSFLIFLTDSRGNIRYSTDEHNGAYIRDRSQTAASSEQANPYRNTDGAMQWQIGAGHYRSLPDDYDLFIQKLTDSKNGEVSYCLENSSAYVHGRVLPGPDGGTVLYISTTLEPVGAAAAILRTQLLVVIAVSLLLSFVIAFLFARRFSRPISKISAQAAHMADGDFACRFEKGFCAELDGLADTLSHTAAELSRTEIYRREFLANISHDLRTPLTMIRGYAEMVRDISWQEEENWEIDLSIIIREADRLTGLVNDIMEYTALQAKTQKVNLEKVDVGTTAKEVLAQFEPLCSQRGFVLDAHIETGLFAFGDTQQIARVLYNLIDNAISHAGETQKIQVTIKRTTAAVRTEVRDFGEGISQSDLPYVWERYFTQKQRKRNQQGSGLGLAISKEILLAHGARFGVESTEGKGSLFWFELNSE